MTGTNPMNPDETMRFVDAAYEASIVETLKEYIRIPAKSPFFDPDWEKNGHIDAAVKLAVDWVKAQGVEGLGIEVLRLAGRTPVILLELEGTKPGTVLLYGHLDKQPEFDGWREGFGPWTPVIENERLYGRGGADDGYAVFASVTAIQAMKAQGAAHPRLVVLIECSEESGSPDLPHYIDAFEARIGSPNLVVCLDSGAGDYERLWTTTSLRGNVVGTLRVEILREGVHSGAASGVVPSSFRIARMLLERLEDAETGRVLPEFLNVEIPELRRSQAKHAAKVLGNGPIDAFPYVEGAQAMTTDPVEAILSRTWKPTVSYTGVGGVPSIAAAGNVLRPFTELKLSLRLPPTLCSVKAQSEVKALLEKDPPYGAKVTFDAREPGDGWEAPESEAWLSDAMNRASRAFFGEDACAMGEGGSIPFMGMLGEKFPKAQFVITGVLGPASNAHGPNEFLHLPTARRLTASVAHILAEIPSP